MLTLNLNWFTKRIAAFAVISNILLVTTLSYSSPTSHRKTVTIRVAGLSDTTSSTITSKITKAVLDKFYALYPYIKVEGSTGLKITGKGMDIVPLMQIAGDISPDILYVNFRQSNTYIQQRFLYPLDEFVKKLSPEELAQMPKKIWPIIRRKGPDGKEHIWAWPTRIVVRALVYRRDLFQSVGLPDRTPRNFKELVAFARKLTDPRKGTYGLNFHLGEEVAWDWMSFLWSEGGDAVVRDKNGNWKCVFDSPEAAESALFFTKLFKQKWTKKYVKKDGGIGTEKITGVVFSDTGSNSNDWEMGRIGMQFIYLNFDNMSAVQNPDLYGIGSVPTGPTGLKGTEFNASMMGIYSGVKDPAVRDAAWKYLSFRRSKVALKAMVDTMVRNGYGRFAQPALLKEFGYPEYARMCPKSWQRAFEESVKYGKPEPYGKNCQQVYRWMSRPLGEIMNDDKIISDINAGDDKSALKKIAKILHQGVTVANEKMLGKISPSVAKFRKIVALIATIIIGSVFFFTFRHIMKVFSPPADDPVLSKGTWQFRKYKIAYLCLIPAVGLIALWQYYPLMSGVLMAFQDYRVTGGSKIVYLDNFANVLFDKEFWFSIWVALKYSLLFMTFGFTAPIFLAILLQEVPKGKIFFRSIYYLPAVVTGLVTIFLWKSFFRPAGLLNQILGLIGIHSTINWIQSPSWALICCVAPVIWAGMGPGCLIYLAALKTVPDDLYEAASIDGAGIMNRIVNITIPSIKALIIINFIGAYVASFQASSFILAMTGGGPYTPQGATEVAGLHIFYTAFMYLKFGVATAMAWILGLMLIGFTVIQLQKLRNMEFKTAGSS